MSMLHHAVWLRNHAAPCIIKALKTFKTPMKMVKNIDVFACIPSPPKTFRR
jgi:hypothetical protein